MKVYLDIETIPGEKRPEIKSLPVPNPEDFSAPSNYKDESKITAYVAKEYLKAVDRWEEANTKNLLEQEEEYRKQALIPEQGRILCLGFAVENEDPVCVNSVGEFYSMLDTMGIVNPIFIGHNIRKFDAPWIFKHSIKEGIKVPTGLEFGFNKFRGNIEDTMELWGCEVYGSHSSLNTIAKFLGEGEKTEGIDGSKVFDYWQEGRTKEIHDYCKQDVELTRSIYKRIKGIK